MPAEKANPLISDGARKERTAVKAYLKRRLSTLVKAEEESGGCVDNLCEQAVIQDAITWMGGRQKRYDKVPGGLGKKVKK